MPATAHGIHQSTIHSAIKKLIGNLTHLKDTTGEFLLKLDDGRVIDTKAWEEDNWEWTHGIGLYGIWQYHSLTDDADSLAIIEEWFEKRFAAGGATKNINTMAVFLTLAHLYEKTSKQSYHAWLDAWGEWAMHRLPRTQFGGMQHVTYLPPLPSHTDSDTGLIRVWANRYLTANSQQLWDDTLMMTVLPLAKIGQVLNRPHYIREAKRQFLLHIQYLFDPKTGLFHHGWVFGGGKGAGHNFAGAAWARGNGWLTVAIPEFLELLDDCGEGGDGELDPFRTHLQNTLLAQCRALKELQHRSPSSPSSSGLWRTILDDESPASYPEASATAGIAFGMFKAARKRYIPSADFEDTAVRALKGVLANINPDTGELGNVSFGTPVFMTKDAYFGIKITPMPYGQSMAVLVLVEFLRAYL